MKKSLIVAATFAVICSAQSFEVAVLPWGAAQVPFPSANAPLAAPIPPVEISIERQPVFALDNFAGTRPPGMALYLITVCGTGGPRRISAGQVRQALAEEGVSIATAYVTRQVLTKTRKLGMSYLARGGQILELVGPGILAATGSGAIKLRPRELAGLASLVTLGRVTVDISRQERDRARDPLGEKQDPWFWDLPAVMDLSNGACTPTVQGLGNFKPGSRAVFTVLTSRGGVS